MEAVDGRKRLRPRKPTEDDTKEMEARLLAAASAAARVVVFSGSGLSSAAGMSCFSDRGGLYERARKQFKLEAGIKLFYGKFHKERRYDAESFFSDIRKEAIQARPTAGHKALEKLAQGGRLLRHVTMNVDGLHRVGTAAAGLTIEMHGCVRDLVCEGCKQVTENSCSTRESFRAARRDPSAGPRCAAPGCGGLLRTKIMLYDDEREDLILDESILEAVEADLAAADLVLWLGISFQQSASTEHFRRARRALQAAGRGGVLQVIVNPSDEALPNITSASCNVENLNLFAVAMTADEFLSHMVGEPVESLAAQDDPPGAVGGEALRRGRRGPRRRRTASAPADLDGVNGAGAPGEAVQADGTGEAAAAVEAGAAAEGAGAAKEGSPLLLSPPVVAV